MNTDFDWLENGHGDGDGFVYGSGHGEGDGFGYGLGSMNRYGYGLGSWGGHGLGDSLGTRLDICSPLETLGLIAELNDRQKGVEDDLR